MMLGESWGRGEIKARARSYLQAGVLVLLQMIAV